MRKRQQHLFKIDDDKLRALCFALPLRDPDKRIAYALAVLCAGTGSYTPAHGVGKNEIASLSGLKPRTIERRLKYLSRYGVLNIKRATGRPNIYAIDIIMVFDAPGLTHDIYKEGSKPDPTPEAAQVAPDPLPLFDQPPAALAIEAHPRNECGKLHLIERAGRWLLSKFTKRPYTAATVDPAALVEPTPAKPTPPPTETPATISETPAKPAPSLTNPPPNPRQTPANSALHIHTTKHRNPNHLKNYTLQKHVHVDLENDFELLEVGPGDQETNPPPGIRKIRWGRSIRDEDLRNPVAIQELYLVAIDQGFILEGNEFGRLNLFALAHYCSRAKKSTNKTGLFSSLLDRTIKDKFNQPFEQKITQADEEWARLAIKHLDFPPLRTREERAAQV